ncbi:MAG: serine/threonine protein kinase, partial [Anaerolineae bacterium]|nr:serine/threonine protein kinase [Anaerolineae bacterium]
KRLRNPFFNRQRITDPVSFHGREREIEGLYSTIITRQCRAVVGERKLGKSSLLTAAAQPATMQRYGLDPARCLFLYLDLEGMSSAQREDFWVDLLERLAAALPPGDLVEHVERFLDEGGLRFTTVRRLLRRVRDKGLDLVLTLDEFEGLARNPAFEPDFYGELRSLAGELGIVYLTASKRSLYELTYHHTGTLSSPFFNIFSELRLGLMPDDEARSLLSTLSQRDGDPGFCEEEIDLAIELAGPHPFFLQIAGFHLFDLPGHGQPQPPDAYDRAARRFNAEAEDHYRYLWSQLDLEEQHALLSPNSAAEDVRRALLTKALIRQEGNRYAPFGHAFAIFVEERRDEHSAADSSTLVEPTTSTDLTGKRLGNYRVLAALGQGGMAKVYKGYQPLLDRYVALKVLAPHFATDEEFRARFQREAAAIARLRHTNIVQVYDFGVEGPVHYMVMEYIAGDTLKSRIRLARARGERLGRDEVLTILRGVAAALDYAHERDIIHRDVKPANIMLRIEETALHADRADDDSAAGATSEAGAGPFIPVLTDFGVAKIMEGVQFTGTGMTIGTPDYMAPEQGSGSPVTPQADLYSLAVILYEMLTGDLPFTADTPVAVLLKHIADTPPPIHLRAPGLPANLDRVLGRALAKKPEDRYPDGAALVDAVEAAWLP